MTSRQLRLMRAVVVSAAATMIAAVSHTFGGGAAPHPLLILAVSTLITPLSAVLIGVRPSRIRTAATVLLAQAAFHVVFQVLGAPTSDATLAASAHAHHLDLSVLAPTSIIPTPSATMWGAHLVASLLTTLLLWHGESMVLAISGWVHALLSRVVIFASADHRRPSRLFSTVIVRARAALVGAVSWRGPPALPRG